MKGATLGEKVTPPSISSQEFRIYQLPILLFFTETETKDLFRLETLNLLFRTRLQGTLI